MSHKSGHIIIDHLTRPIIAAVPAVKTWHGYAAVAALVLGLVIF